MRKLVWVDTPKSLDEVIRKAKAAKSVALDAEMDSYYSYKTKLCLVQMSVDDWDILIDPLTMPDLSPLNELTQNPDIVKVFHAGENDVPYFREHGVTFENIFDTHIAAKVLELSTKSLGGLVELYYDVVLPKDQSRADWRIRPLPEEQVEYARQDTLYLCDLGDRLHKDLKEANGLTEAGHYFKALEPRTLRVKEFEPEAWAKIKGARELNGVQRSILHELFAWREKEAEKADLAVFRIAHNGALISLSRKKFRYPDELCKWAKNAIFKREAEAVIAAMKRGRERGAIPFPDLRKKKDKDWTPADEKVFEKLRKWRNAESEKQGIDPSRVFSNKQLKKMARQRPKSEACLNAVDGLEAWKVEQYAEAVLAALGV